jgi:CxxC motif-containing protein (DUF1111 family)
MQRSPSARNLLVVVTAGFLASFTLAVQGQTGATEAAAGFDNLPVPGVYPGTTVQQQTAFAADKATFEERDEIGDGLGPVYNAQSCAECHQNPVTGAVSQISELRAGHRDVFGNFVDAPGGSLINDRAIKSSIQELVPGAEDVRTFRMSTNTLGDGFVEAIANSTLQAIASAQPGQSSNLIQGQLVAVPVAEAGGATRFGRFGWKNQHASLLSFASDAYLNEMGITNRFNLVENTSLGKFIGFGSGFDTVPDNATCDSDAQVNCGEDPEEDIVVFARFMRATKAPPRGPSSTDSTAGSTLFDSIGCNICHVRNITTALAGTSINGGAFTVPAGLGNKIIHPFSDFLLHDIDTGDGVVQNGGQSTRNKLRTQPLWGVRTHDRHMHDGASLTFNESILRHGGEATFVTNRYRNLTGTQQNQLIAFLKSL